MVLLHTLDAVIDPFFTGVLLITGWFYMAVFWPTLSDHLMNGTTEGLQRYYEEEFIDAKINHHRNIANFGLFGATDIIERLVLRAGPNQRLVAAFGIDNSFTTTNVDRHRHFRDLCVELIGFRIALGPKSSGSAKWSEARDMATKFLDVHAACEQIPIAEVVRTMCFTVVSQVLLPFEISDPEHVRSVTERINKTWLRSKTAVDDAEEYVRIEKDCFNLRDELDDMFESVDYKGFHILDLIMPAYETLWRIVLLTYIHVSFRHISEQTRQTVQEVVEMVGRRPYVEFNTTTKIFSKEALRLYPPTKRIYRAAEDGAQQAADVEFLHHAEEIWGDDSKEFRPDRFRQLTKRQRDAYMPFGIGQHTCPAGGGFSGKLIAILVVALMEKVGKKESGARLFTLKGLNGCDHTNGREGSDGEPERLLSTPLPTGRDDQAGWLISRGQH